MGDERSVWSNRKVAAAPDGGIRTQTEGVYGKESSSWAGNPASSYETCVNREDGWRHGNRGWMTIGRGSRRVMEPAGERVRGRRRTPARRAKTANRRREVGKHS